MSNTTRLIATLLIFSHTPQRQEICHAQEGIQPTPVIDLGLNAIFFLALTVDQHVPNVRTPIYRLHALDLATGGPKPNSPVLIAATYQVSAHAS